MRLTKVCFVGGIVCGRIATSLGLAALTPRRSSQKSSAVLATSAFSSSSSVNEFHRWAAVSICAASLLIGGPCQADEFGVERDAPTLYTGETVEVSYCNLNRSNVTCPIQLKLATSAASLLLSDLHKTRSFGSMSQDRAANGYQRQ
jgi:hypothetical protein